VEVKPAILHGVVSPEETRVGPAEGGECHGALLLGGLVSAIIAVGATKFATQMLYPVVLYPVENHYKTGSVV